MKREKVLLIVGVVVAFLVAFVLLLCSFNISKGVKAEIFRTDFVTMQDESVDTLYVIEGKTLKLEKYSADSSHFISNDIKILKITDKYVEISRNVTKYDDNSKKYTEEVFEKVNYNEKIELAVNETPPGLEFETPRFVYKLFFVKK